MDKTPREVVYDIMLKQNFQDAFLDECEEISAAVIAHVTPQIRAAAIEDAATACDNENQRIRLNSVAIKHYYFMQTEARSRELAAAYVEEMAATIRALAPLPPGHVCVSVELVPAINALLHQLDIGTFFDEHGHSAKMLKPVHDLMRLLSAAKEPK